MPVGLAQLSSSGLEPVRDQLHISQQRQCSLWAQHTGHLPIVAQTLEPDKTSINIPGKNTGAATLGLDMVFQMYFFFSF